MKRPIKGLKYNRKKAVIASDSENRSALQIGYFII